LIASAAERSQVIVVSHASRLIAALQEDSQCHAITLEKEFGATKVSEAADLETPAWHWPSR
jgi:predicted ATPase